MEGLVFVFGIIAVYLMLRQASQPSQNSKLRIWEILVPASSPTQEFTYEHHKKWDEYVKSLAGGLTILKTAKGEWISPEGKLYTDKVIPVRIVCRKKHIKKIIKFTITHYNQEAVLAYKVSNKTILTHKAST